MKQVTALRRKSLRNILSTGLLSLLLPLVVFGSMLPDRKRAEQVDGSCRIVRAAYVGESQAGVVTLDHVLLASDAQRLLAAPGKLFLDQNYPNPFNPTTMIRYGLPSGADVKITIHSLLGNQIKVVVDQYQDAGIYVLDLSAHDLPSGVYFYRLQTELGTLTRRMTISK